MHHWVPREIEELVMDCLAKNPEDRPQSARDLAERFETAVERARTKVDSDPGRQGLSGERPPLSAERPVLPVNGLSGERSAASAATAVLQGPAPSREQAALPFHMDAWMPEAIAIVKLRGFVHDNGGEVVESVPGLIKVRLGARKGASNAGPLSWFGLRRASNTVDVELHFSHADMSQPNKLTVDVLFRPPHPTLLTDRDWRAKCTQVFVELRSYLMGRSE
jgi:serine/threonine-protein kinase